jgi:glycogen(starch) synthase
MRALRVLITSDAAGGVASFARGLAAALAARGHQPWLAVFGRAGSEAWPSGVELFAADLPLEWMDGSEAGRLPEAIARGRAWLAQLARAARPDVLHCNQFAYVGSVAGVPSLLTVHSDVRSWWRHVRAAAPPEDAYQRWYRTLAEQALARAALVAAPSRAAAADLAASFASARPVEVIANGAGGPSLAPEGERQPLVVTLARAWDPAKQIALLGACRSARAAGWELVVAGETTHPATGAATATPDGVRLLGRLPQREAEALLARAAIYVAPSRYEPFGLAPLEAAQAGCALLLNDIASFREIWGEAAAYFARNDGTALDAALGRLIGDAAGRTAVAERARERARALSAARMAAAYEAAYRRCLR